MSSIKGKNKNKKNKKNKNKNKNKNQADDKRQENKPSGIPSPNTPFSSISSPNTPISKPISKDPISKDPLYPKWSDQVFVVGGKKYYAIRGLLMKNCPYFSALFDQHPLYDPIVLAQETDDGFEDFLNLFEGKKVKLQRHEDLDRALAIYKLADYYGVQFMIDELAKFILPMIPYMKPDKLWMIVVDCPRFTPICIHAVEQLVYKVKNDQWQWTSTEESLKCLDGKVKDRILFRFFSKQCLNSDSLRHRVNVDYLNDDGEWIHAKCTSDKNRIQAFGINGGQPFQYDSYRLAPRME